MMFHKLLAVKPMDRLCLLVEFVGGERKMYDVTPLLEKWPPFRDLPAIRGLWEQVKVDAGGYGISWNDAIDLSCNELYENGVAV